jgi:hypothetical protein
MTPPQTDYRTIPLTHGQFTIVDAANYERLNQYKWYAHYDPQTQRYYAARSSMSENGKRHNIWMHREVLGLSYGDPRKGDHKENANTLDNRQSNLRITDHIGNQHNASRNKANTSGFKGVWYYPPTNKWRSAICNSGTRIYLGYFSTPELAHAAYCAAAKEYHGEFARFN